MQQRGGDVLKMWKLVGLGVLIALAVLSGAAIWIATDLDEEPAIRTGPIQTGPRAQEMGLVMIERKQGQDAGPITLAWTDMNEDERAVAKFLAASTSSATIKVLANATCGGNTSRVRNALRRLVRGGWALRANDERGTYLPGKPGGAIGAADPRSRVRTLDPELAGKDFDTAVVVVSALEHAGSDTKVAKATGYSRGFVKPRLDRLKKAKVLNDTVLANATTLRAAIAVAQGGQRS